MNNESIFFQTNQRGLLTSSVRNEFPNQLGNQSITDSARYFFQTNETFRNELPFIVARVNESNNDHSIFHATRDHAWSVSATLDGDGKSINWHIKNGKLVTDRNINSELLELRGEIRGLQWMENFLSHQQERFKRVEQMAHVGHWIYDFTENSFSFSDEVYQIFQWEKSVFTPALDDFLKSVHPDDRLNVRSEFQNHIDCGNECSFSYRILCKNGVIKTLEHHSSFENNTGDHPISYTIIQDVTTNRKLTEQLEKSQQFLAQLGDNIHELFVLFDCKTKEALYISSAYSTLYGCEIPANKEFSALLLATVHPEHSGSIQTLFNDVIDGRMKIGKGEFPVENHGNKSRHLEIQIVPILNEGGDIIRVATVTRDITREKEKLEEKHVQEKILRQADQMAKLSTLVTGVAHEINNPNNLIMLNVTFLTKLWLDIIQILDIHSSRNPGLKIKNLPYDEVREEFIAMLQSILNGSERIKNIVASLKQFAGSDAGSFDETINLNLLVEQTLLITGAMIRKIPAKTEVTYYESGIYVKGNKQQLQHVLVNIITNSCESFSDSNGHISIAIDHVENNAVIIISDNGCGIHPANIERCMDPFFTTRREFGSEGLGLPAAYGILCAHDGTIAIESELTKGTTVTIHLPLFQQTIREGNSHDK